MIIPKLVVAGATGVGKSSLTIQFVKNEFSENYIPTLEDSYTKPVNIDGEVSVVEIVDTAGADHFMAMKYLYYNTADGFLLLCSVDEKDSLDEMKKIKNSIMKSRENEQVPIVACINKNDLSENDWALSKGEYINDLSKNMNCPLFFTSAKNKNNVQQAFETVLKLMKQSLKKKEKACRQSKKKNCVVM